MVLHINIRDEFITLISSSIFWVSNSHRLRRICVRLATTCPSRSNILQISASLWEDWWWIVRNSCWTLADDTQREGYSVGEENSLRLDLFHWLKNPTPFFLTVRALTNLTRVDSSTECWERCRKERWISPCRWVVVVVVVIVFCNSKQHSLQDFSYRKARMDELYYTLPVEEWEVHLWSIFIYLPIYLRYCSVIIRFSAYSQIFPSGELVRVSRDLLRTCNYRRSILHVFHCHTRCSVRISKKKEKNKHGHKYRLIAMSVTEVSVRAVISKLRGKIEFVCSHCISCNSMSILGALFHRLAIIFILIIYNAAFVGLATSPGIEPTRYCSVQIIFSRRKMQDFDSQGRFQLWFRYCDREKLRLWWTMRTPSNNLW